jgi:hypothetical protein
MNILTEKDVARFWGNVAKTDNPNDCWLWTAHCISDGYGSMRVGGKETLAHRISWTIAYGEIPDGLSVCHHCDRPPCCNPNHLWLGTHKENMDDRERKGRGNQPSGDRNGTHLHPEKLARGDRNGKYTHPEKTPRGESHGMSKLTWEQVREIRRRYAFWGMGGDSAYKLAKEFGVAKHTILEILHNKIWKE